MSDHQHDHAHDHAHGHQHGSQHADDYTQETWDARYAESARVWSGNPNPLLVTHVADLDPGEALDVGAGEGADSVWLAERGWRVTSLDVSPVALGKVRAHAEESGVGDRVRTLQHDLISTPLVPGTYDLVSAQFWHPPAELRAASYLGLAATVRPGGTLLVVGHHPTDLRTGTRNVPGRPDKLFVPEDVESLLPAEQWDVRVAGTPTRQVQRDDGPADVTDSVVLAVRR